MHSPGNLITTLVFSITLAFALGLIAHRLRMSPLLGYLLAGVAIGPHTPGFVADSFLAPQLAEFGVILIMFGIGLKFSLDSLSSVKIIVVPGALIQIAFTTAMGYLLGQIWGLAHVESVLMGFALSIGSTVVLLRSFEDRKMIATRAGSIAVGWLIIQDLIIILALVLMPVLASLLKSGEGSAGTSPAAIAEIVVLTLGKVAAFVAIMMIAGRRFLPWLLILIARTKSRELFSLGTFAMAIGIAYAAYALFGASFALGAFFAGLVLSESEESARAADYMLPLRDAFAVLFFVSVGMLFNPAILVTETLSVLAVVILIIAANGGAAYAILRAAKQPYADRLAISAGLAQIGEFSFVLATLGLSLGLMTQETRDLILAGAFIAIAVNPFLLRGTVYLAGRNTSAEAVAPEVKPAAPTPAETIAERASL